MAAGRAKRYRQLIERALFDLKLAQDAALSAHLPAARLARIQRARRELREELAALETVGKGSSGAHREQSREAASDVSSVSRGAFQSCTD